MRVCEFRDGAFLRAFEVPDGFALDPDGGALRGPAQAEAAGAAVAYEAVIAAAPGAAFAVSASAGAGWTRDAAGALAPPPPPPPDRAALAAYARRRSWEIETAGIAVAGVVVATDRDSQGLIARMHALAQREPGRLFRFDALSGPVTLDAAQASALARAVDDHVQAAFARRCAVVAAIEASPPTIASEAAVDAALAAP